MSRVFRGVVPLLAAGVAAAVVAAGVGGTGNQPARAGGELQAQPARSEGKPNTKAALPTKEELPEFEAYRAYDDSSGTITTSTASAARKDDGAGIRVTAIVASSEAEAKEWVYRHAVAMQSIGPFAKGSPSGQQIGEECWNSNRSGGPPKGGLQVIARDGRAIASVMIDRPVKRDKTGGPLLHEPIDAKDVRKVEQEAIKVLGKFARKGYTSKPAN